MSSVRESRHHPSGVAGPPSRPLPGLGSAAPGAAAAGAVPGRGRRRVRPLCPPRRHKTGGGGGRGRTRRSGPGRGAGPSGAGDVALSTADSGGAGRGLAAAPGAMAGVQQGEKQLFEKFWRGTFKAVATPRPESIIVASITARKPLPR